MMPPPLARLAFSALCALAATLSAGAAVAQAPAAWPQRPVRIIVPFPAGGSTMESVVRLLTQDMAKALGHQVYIEPRPGAGTVIGVDLTAKSTDGHTFVGVANSFTVNQTLVKALPYDTLKDLQPVVLMARTANVLAAHPSVAPDDLRALIAYAKRNPGKLSYASFGNGTTAHFAGEMLKVGAGIDMVHIPYKGQGPALIDLLAGNVDLMFGNLPDFLPHIRAGKLKAYGTTFLKRVPQAPELPATGDDKPLNLLTRGTERTNPFPYRAYDSVLYSGNATVQQGRHDGVGVYFQIVGLELIAGEQIELAFLEVEILRVQHKSNALAAG